jgi:hypothetical protein
VFCDDINNKLCNNTDDCCGDGDFNCVGNKCVITGKACYFVNTNDEKGNDCPSGLVPPDSRCGELTGTPML